MEDPGARRIYLEFSKTLTTLFLRSTFESVPHDNVNDMWQPVRFKDSLGNQSFFMFPKHTWKAFALKKLLHLIEPKRKIFTISLNPWKVFGSHFIGQQKLSGES